jgi:putative intracellular protease/amidase
VINPVPTPGNAATTGQTAQDTAQTQDNTSTDAMFQGGTGDAHAADVGAMDPSASLTPTFVPVDPVQADSAASPGGDVHLAVFAPVAVPSGKLVVFLAAPGHKTTDYKLFLTEAARLGHRALALAGPADVDVAVLCGQNVGCFEAVRREVLDGLDHSPKVTVKYADCLENRLTHALLWLQDHETEAGWGQFLDSGKPLWTQVIVAGHGQGAAEAMMLAAWHEVARVVLLAGPADGDAQGPAPWLATHLTTSGKIRGFCHTQDPQWPAVNQAWTALGMGGKADRVDVDQTPPPYYDLHQLTTSIPMANEADSIVTDAQTPLQAGIPQFAQVWRGLLGK